MVTIYRGSLADGLDVSSGKLKIANGFFSEIPQFWNLFRQVQHQITAPD